MSITIALFTGQHCHAQRLSELNIRFLDLQCQAPSNIVLAICIRKISSACRTGYKQEEREAIAQQENIVVIKETWWNEWDNWSAAVDGCKLFRRDSQGRRGCRVALRECFYCLQLINGDNRVQCLWVNITNKPTQLFSAFLILLKYIMYSRPLNMMVVLWLTQYTKAMSSLYWGAPNWTVFQIWSPKCQTEAKGHLTGPVC